jgi:SIT4-associating protein SAP185/190
MRNESGCVLKVCSAPSSSPRTLLSISITSSKFENNFIPSASASTDELRIANSSEEDGFEKVAVAEASDGKEAEKLEVRDDLVDEPLSPRQARSKRASDSALSPTTKLGQHVRRLSIEDTEMTSPPNEAVTTDKTALTSPISPHPEDKPAPLSFKKIDPNKTPTPRSPEPEPPTSPRSPRTGSQETGMDSQVEGDSIQVHDSILHDQSCASEESPVVGDYLKIQFVSNHVVPTILNFFFRFPWNNFLHNVVYDVVQQVFNGPMDRGYNRFLAFDLFETGQITHAIISGQQRSDEAQKNKNMRLGYMGHLTLVAEEVVKFGERQPKELLSPPVQESIYGREWDEYVNKILAETRERDNAILGGFRPESGLGPRQAILNSVNPNAALGPSAALQNAGIGGQPLDSIELSRGSDTSEQFPSSGSLLSEFASSSDDEDEEMDDADDDRAAAAAAQLTTADVGPGAENVCSYAFDDDADTVCITYKTKKSCLQS